MRGCWRSGGTWGDSDRSRQCCLAVALLATVIAPAAIAAGEAVISDVSVERRGETLELHFRLMGAPQLRMTGRGNQLTIDLGHTRLTIPPRPLFGLESAPLSLLRAIEKPDGDSQLIIEVVGKTDYALAQPVGEILIRLAPAGKVADLDAPLSVPRRSRQSNAATVAPAETVIGDGLRNASIAGSVTERIAGLARVVIDPGHGGYDPGARDASGRFAEKDLALEIAIMLARELEGSRRERRDDARDRYVPEPARAHAAC